MSRYLKFGHLTKYEMTLGIKFVFNAFPDQFSSINLSLRHFPFCLSKNPVKSFVETSIFDKLSENADGCFESCSIINANVLLENVDPAKENCFIVEQNCGSGMSVRLQFDNAKCVKYCKL